MRVVSAGRSPLSTPLQFGRAWAAALVLAALVSTGWSAAGAAAQSTERVSVDGGGTQSDRGSFGPSVSADGRFVAFQSAATNLVGGDTNAVTDVFVRDRLIGTTERISITAGGAQPDRSSLDPTISADGRFVAFDSDATNLVAGDTNNRADVFVRDRVNATTERVSVAADGSEANNFSFRSSISADGQSVVFDSSAANLVDGDSNNRVDVFVRDRDAATTERVSVAGDGTQANGTSSESTVSADGQIVAFGSSATNLVAGDTNGRDVFVRDRTAGTTERVSVADDGTQANVSVFEPSMSADGRFVAFATGSTNLVAGDTNGFDDVFVHDRQTATTERVSLTSDGGQTNSSAFTPAISADGRVVAFETDATNLVAGDTNNATDVFVRDRRATRTARVSVAGDGSQADDGSTAASISTDGRYVAFASDATNLVTRDTNTTSDVVVRDRGDVVDPTVVIAVPVDGATYAQGATVAADFSCADADAGIASCVGTVADGQPIDTATLGAKSFTVTAIDNAGNDAVLTVSYSVVEAPDLALSLEGLPNPITVGSPLTYKLRLRNLGSLTITGAMAVLTLSPSETFVSATSACSHAAGVVTCRIPRGIVPGAGATPSVTVIQGQAGLIQTRATASSDLADPNPANNSALERTRVTP